MADPIVPVKPGVFTTEFWAMIIATMVVTGVTLLNHFFNLGLDVYEVSATVVPAVFYILGRTGIKMSSNVSSKAVTDRIATIVAANKPTTPPQV